MGVRRSWRILARGRFFWRAEGEEILCPPFAGENSGGLLIFCSWLHIIRVPQKSTGGGALQLGLDFGEEASEFDGFGIEIIATGGAGFFFVTGHGVGGKGD